MSFDVYWLIPLGPSLRAKSAATEKKSDLGAPGWGERWFPQQCCVASFTHRSRVWRCLCWGALLYLFFRHTNTMDDTMSSAFFQLLTLRNWPPVHFACLACLCVVVVLLVCCFPSLLPSGIVTDHWTVYWSCVSSTFAVHLL